MGPQIPMGGNPQKPFANRREDGCLRVGVGAEIVQLHPVEVQNRSHETTCRHSEPPLVKRDETQHIPRGRDGAAPLGGAIHSGCGSPERGRSKLSAARASRSSAVTVEKGHGARGRMTVTRSAITKRRRRRRSGQGPGETRSTLRPNPPRNSKLEGETPVPRTARARTTAAPRTTRPVALTLRQDRRHLWHAKQATLHLRLDDRVKKGAPRRSISYPFPLPLSLSCYRDRERGYSERDPSPRRKRAPSPPTDQRFEGWPLGRVQQPPQSTRTPRPLLVRGSKAGPSEGFDSHLRPLGLRAHYWSKVRRLAPRKGSTAASGHSGSAPTTDQGFVG
jgi:hypothetical protein